MKKKWVPLLILACVIVSLFMPAVKIYVHSGIAAETAAAFPETLSLGSLMLKGSAALPLEAVPQLVLAQIPGWMLLCGVALLLLSVAVLFLKWRRSLYAAMACSALSLAFSFSFSLQLQNTCSSLLFQLLLTAQFWIYVPAAAALIQLLVLALMARKEEALFSSTLLRKLGGLLALAGALCVLLPCITVNVPDTLTEDAADAAAMNRSHSLLQEMLGQEANLNLQKTESGVYQNVLSGDLAVLEPFSKDGNNISGVFLIQKNTSSMNAYLLSALVLLLLSALLSFLPKVNQWFTAACQAVALLAVGATVLSVTGIGEADMYASASRQLVHLGVGTITVVPMLLLVISLGALSCGALSIHAANVPYFVNPIPQKLRLRVVALLLAFLSLACCFLPVAEFSFYKAGKTNVVSTVSFSALDSLLFRQNEDLLSPKDKKGKTMYQEDAAEDELSASVVASGMSTLLTSTGVCQWLTLLLTLGGIVMVFLRQNKKTVIAIFLAAFLVRAVQWLLLSVQMNTDVGEVAASVWLYLSLPLLLFSAFFANFTDMVELPKKYRLFLMILPFLVSVFLFSYLPLVGWRYAFYNYKFGIPMSHQEWVGFKWFTEMFTNSGHFTNIVRVMKNTLGMSLLSLAFSWLPMFFAIFLNEIGNARFKKFVQIFTTLPNFISWALVFSFAMAMFAMDTGIYSKFMLSIGAITEPVAWLNSSEHIWLKMWGWGLWKGLGWSSIMYLAAIAGIDQEMYEAAKVDGANRWHIMRYITLPSLLPTFFVLLLLSISNIINSGMDQYLVFQNMNNKNTIEVLDLYVYNITIASKGTTMYSFGTAIGILKTLVSVTLLFSANFASKKLRGQSIV